MTDTYSAYSKNNKNVKESTRPKHKHCIEPSVGYMLCVLSVSFISSVL